MNFSQLFGIFSNRHKVPSGEGKPLTKEFRYRVLQLCQDVFSDYTNFAIIGSRVPIFWLEIHKKLQYFHGRLTLPNHPTGSYDQDTFAFLSQCSDEHFLDFVEMICQTDIFREVDMDEDKLVNPVNEFLRQDELPYSLTGFTFEEHTETSSYGQEHRVISTASYPQIIRRESELIHNTAIEPTLVLLSNSSVFSSANKEFLGALADYRKGDYTDCITKCGSSFESIMKIICNRKSWDYKQTDTASALLNNILPHTNLESFFEQPIMLIATIRNRLSSSHGGGMQPRTVSQQVANFAINATASAILLLVAETNP